MNRGDVRGVDPQCVSSLRVGGTWSTKRRNDHGYQVPFPRYRSCFSVPLSSLASDLWLSTKPFFNLFD